MAQAIEYVEFGEPEVLTLHEVTSSAPAAGEVTVRLAAVGVNPLEAKIRSGRRPSGEITTPRRLGADAAGTISAVGDDVEGFRVGDPVIVFGASGAYATELTVPFANVQPRPVHVSAAEGAALGIPAGTAYQTLRSLDVRPGDTLLVHGGSGAVGQAVAQFAALWGIPVVATASPRRHERLRALGAIPVAYGAGLEDRVRAAAPQGITAVIDIAGTDEAIDVSLHLLGDRSRIVTLVRGKDAAGLGIRAFLGGSPEPLTARQQQLRAEAMPVVLNLMAAGRFSVELGPSFALADAAEAHRVLEAGVDGKITLTL
ncbi:NADP-dependent oxidoreductase [Microbacterium protaetiae]|uniref:NADP-dependent oxidoreductase n=1 Tax=Microbacterium protaetiae TaxID=2509458 RepID=A0A4V0YCW3_9MICO|nr:NADP-dependent oxidoreductase [Microbacterium protaetiae]QAY58611.1 NADP-dependent oxidoreductase [Microbacterium protaetiae]